MASRYSVIQYVPNPIADERINIGVLVFDEQSVRVHFLQNWDRVRFFNPSEDIDVLKNFAVEMDEVTKEGLLFPGDRSTNIPTHERLGKVARGWRNGIQFTEPRGSLAGVEELLNELAQTHLLEPFKNSELPMHENIEFQNIKDKDSITKIYDTLKPILEESSNTGLQELIFKFIRPKKQIKNKLKITSELTQSTFEYGMISLERSYLPDGDYKIHKITEDLSFLDLYSLQTVELYLNRLNRVSDKDIKNSQRLYPFVMGIITALLIFTLKEELRWLAVLSANFVVFYWVFYSIPLDKKSLFGRTELCIHVLKESQIIKHQRKAQK
jgi:hypothetical protein